MTWFCKRRRGWAVGLHGALVLALVGSSPSVAAEPSLWDLARSPESGLAETLLRRADRSRVPLEPEYSGQALQQKLNERSALMIQLARGEELGDPRLRYLLGECLVHAGGSYHAAGRRVLLRALSESPLSPGAATAWQDVALASGWLGDHEAARAAYARALEIEAEPEVRSVLYLNRAESSMALGRLEAAISDYRTAAFETSALETRSLAQWGLAVALDRQLDFPGARAWVIAASRGRFGPAGTQLAVDLDH
ncbi:MAG: hypothetical protein RJA70_2735, partial [Pseudomonadota bacterium]